MYESNFGFHRQPFQCTDHARAFYASESIRAILPQLLHALRSDLGIAVLTGPAGVGKTSLLKHLQSILSNEGRAVVCSGAGLETPSEVLQTLQSATQLRAGESPADTSRTATTWSRWAVVEQMRKTTEFWGPILLLVDDAQLLSVPVLNELRAFTEEEWNGRSLVRCLIAGPLNLEEEMARPSHVDFSRRIRCHAFLQPLSSAESIAFLGRHLEVVGGKLHSVFAPAALDLISSASDGLPRCLSLLADESLVVAAEQSQTQADENCVRKALTRLQHLAYPWNASPLRAENEENPYRASHDNSSVARNSEEAGEHQQETTQSTGVIEIGAVGGVIEIGGNTNVAGSKSCLLITREKHDIATSEPISHAVAATEPADAEPIGRHSAIEHLFEVGHRYQPDAIESSDVVEMDHYSPYEQSTVVASSSVSASFESEELFVASTRDPHQAYSDIDQIVNEGLAELAESSPIDSEPGLEFATTGDKIGSVSSEQPHSETHLLREHGVVQNENAISEHSQFRNERDPAGEAPARDFVEREFFGNISAGLSSNRPIFDRYTWITLGREVPAGPYSGSAASDRQRASNLHQQVFDIEPTNFNSTCFDRIRVVKTSDAEIEASLIQHTVEQKTGSFFVSKSASRPQKLYMGIAVNNSDPETQPTTEQQPFVGVEHFNSPEFDTKANDTIDTGRSPAAVNTAAQKLAADVSSVPAVSERIPLVDIVTEADRHLIQTAIRNTLSGSVLSSALNKDSENICTPAAGGSPVTSENSPDRIEQVWHDGQLIFEENASPTSAPQQQDEQNSDSATTTEKISLNFEAARIARDESSQSMRETSLTPTVTDKFYTLPDTTRTIAWDLRSALTAADEITPLADSVASLRESVTSFQQSGRINAAASHTLESSTEPSPHNEQPGESLVAIAKRRLQKPASSTNTDALPAEAPPEASSQFTLTARNQTPATMLPVKLRNGSATASLSTAVPQTASGSQEQIRAEGQHQPNAGFGQLFTRLRKLRSQVTEIR